MLRLFWAIFLVLCVGGALTLVHDVDSRDDMSDYPDDPSDSDVHDHLQPSGYKITSANLQANSKKKNNVTPSLDRQDTPSAKDVDSQSDAAMDLVPGPLKNAEELSLEALENQLADGQNIPTLGILRKLLTNLKQHSSENTQISSVGAQGNALMGGLDVPSLDTKADSMANAQIVQGTVEDNDGKFDNPPISIASKECRWTNRPRRSF